MAVTTTATVKQTVHGMVSTLVFFYMCIGRRRALRWRGVPRYYIQVMCDLNKLNICFVVN